MNEQLVPPIIDLHQDLLSHIKEREMFQNVWQTNHAMMDRSSIRAVIATAFPLPADDNFFDMDTERLIEQELSAYSKVAETNPGWEIARDLRQIAHAVHDPSGPRRIIAHVEGLNTLTIDSFPMLERWYDLGWRSAGLVWNLTNSLGGGTHDATTGLTALGRDILAWLEQKSMIIDLSHMNEPTFWGTMKATKGVVIASHANAKAVCDHVRNLSDDQIEAIANRGGVIGVTLIGQTVAPQDANIPALIRHINHIRDLVGIDHIAFGSDLGGVLSGLVQGVGSVAEIPLLFSQLSEAGYSSEDLAKIAHGNFLRVLLALE